ncbi:MAG: hypothetical protein ABS934_06485 [Psychrobacillus sp.]
MSNSKLEAWEGLSVVSTEVNNDHHHVSIGKVAHRVYSKIF